MTSCVVKWCRTRKEASKKITGITYHRFPQHDIQRWKWIEAVRLERRDDNWLPTRASRVCSIHFEDEEMYSSGTGYRLLKKTAVPVCTMVRRKKHQEQFEPLMVPESTKPQEQMMDPLQLEYEFKKELSEPSSDITDSLQLEHQIEETPGVPVSGIEEFLQYKHQFNEKPDVSSPGVANPLPLENQFKEETEVPPLGVATSNENQIKSTSIDNNIIIITTDCAVQPQQQLAVASYPQWEAATMTPNNIAGTLITGVQNVSQAHFQNYIAPIVPSFFISNLVDLNTIQPMDQQSQEQQSQEQQSNLNTTANERKRMVKCPRCTYEYDVPTDRVDERVIRNMKRKVGLLKAENRYLQQQFKRKSALCTKRLSTIKNLQRRNQRLIARTVGLKNILKVLKKEGFDNKNYIRKENERRKQRRK